MNGLWRMSLMTILAAVIGVSGGVYGVKADDDDGIEGDVITIDYSGYKKDRKGPTKFTHRKHAKDYNVSCWECHHEYDKEGKNIWVPWGEMKTCDECHDPREKQGKAVNLQKAFHLNCKVCHETLALQKKKSGPYKKCLGCHEKVKKEKKG